jgi:glycerol-3-phosphate dehydrogenase
MIIDKAFDLSTVYSDAAQRLLAAEIHYTTEYEMALHLSDFFIRRNGNMYFDRKRVDAMKLYAADIFTQIFTLAESDTALQLRFLEEALSTLHVH